MKWIMLINRAKSCLYFQSVVGKGDEIKSWLAFAALKVIEVGPLAKAIAGQKDEAYFAANAAAQASRKCSPRVNNEAVQKADLYLLAYNVKGTGGFTFSYSKFSFGFSGFCFDGF